MQCRFVTLAVALATAASVQAANIDFQVNYTDDPSEGFNDPTHGSARRAAFEYAMGLWGTQFQASFVGETVRVNASFDPLAGTTLGQAGASFVDANFGSINPKYQANTYYPDALVNHLVGEDIWEDVDIVAAFNSNVGNWHYGTDGAPGANVDFVTVAMHEIGHGLGFSSAVTSTGSMGAYPTIYERFVYGGTAGPRLDQMASDAERLAAVTSGELYWDGLEGITANGGERPQLYAPLVFVPESSIAHLDEAIYTLMGPSYSGPVHELSLVERGMLSDMGWTLVPEPGIAGAVGVCLLALARRQRNVA